MLITCLSSLRPFKDSQHAMERSIQGVPRLAVVCVGMLEPARSSGRRERIALVLAGGGARGAYEVGALSALAPALAARGETLDIIVGTSIGALNGAFFAARADEPLQAAAAAGLEMWNELGWSDALRPLV